VAKKHDAIEAWRRKGSQQQDSALETNAKVHKNLQTSLFFNQKCVKIYKFALRW